MNSEKLTEWFLSLDKTTQIEQIKKHSIQLHSYKKSMEKANKADNCARMYEGCKAALKLMVKLL